MPTIYDIDYDQQSIDLLPPDKRDVQPVTLVRSLFSSLQRARDLVLGSFKIGSTTPAYVSGSYLKYDLVKFNKSIYESKKDSNTDLPTVSASWLLIQPNFIGVDERIKYNGQVLVLTWALNLEFDGVFRQPATGLNSDIYIENLPATLQGFRLGETEAGTSVSSIGEDTASASIGGNFPLVQGDNFNIKFPAALYALTNESAVRNFVDKYIPASIFYTITTY